MKKATSLRFNITAAAALLFAGASSVDAQTAFSRPKSAGTASPLPSDVLGRIEALASTPLPSITVTATQNGLHRYPWKREIVTTVFWIGEGSSSNNPVPNQSSSWDATWSRSYGGFDDPNPTNRQNYLPVHFTPKQNPFYCALPYNDKAREGHRSEAPKVVPWFKEAYQGPTLSVCKDRWVEIRKGDRIVYAQWEDAGPFRTDHWEYVFGNDRPKPNLNHGAGLDVSPAVRDYLGLAPTDVTDWKFVDFKDVPTGPWARHGENNTFILAARKTEQELAKARNSSSVIFR